LLIPKRHGQTDRQTDGRLTVALPRSALASRGKNVTKLSASVCRGLYQRVSSRQDTFAVSWFIV